jgi:hypothetical protein
MVIGTMMRVIAFVLACLFTATPAVAHRHVSHHIRYHDVEHVSLAHIIPALAVKTQQIVSICGCRVISALRPGAVVAGTNHPSLHRDGRAVDLQGNPHCIYSMLQGFSGGYSIDYNVVHHVHVSLGGREDGTRFVHGGSHHHHGHHYRHVRIA